MSIIDKIDKTATDFISDFGDVGYKFVYDVITQGISLGNRYNSYYKLIFTHHSVHGCPRAVVVHSSNDDKVIIDRIDLNGDYFVILREEVNNE